MGVCGSGLYKRMLMPGQLFRDGLARNSLVDIGFSEDAGFHVSRYLRFPGLRAGHDLKARVEVDHG